MENMSVLYNSINTKGISSIRNKKEYVDYTIDDPNDTRMGLSLLIRPDKKVCQNLVDALSKVQKIEPDQYFYQPSDFHITLFTLKSAVSDFTFSDVQKENCINLTKEVLRNHSPFSIDLKGLILSDACIIATGYTDKTINSIRQSIRLHLNDYALSNTERYPIETAHITIGRFRKNITDSDLFLSVIDEFKDYNFGSFTVNEVELVYHNWFDSKKEILETFTL